MEKKPLIIFFVISALLVIAFVIIIILFIIQYRNRRIQYNKETSMLQKLHQQQLLETELHIQVQTMQDIGREIHDNVGQKLTLASIYTQQLSHTNAYPIIQEQLHAISDILSDSLHTLRGLSKSITNESITSSEFVKLIQAECEKMNALQLCIVHFHSNDAPYHVMAVQKNFILRIIQEFVQNSLKHAQCKNIQIHLQIENEQLHLFILDDGIGFDPSIKYEGIGLSNMRKRAELLKASFELKSELGKGTQIDILLPLK